MPRRRRPSLSASSRAVLAALAKSGRVLSGGELVHVAGISWSRLVDSLSALERRQLVYVDRGRVSLTKRGRSVLSSLPAS